MIEIKETSQGLKLVLDEFLCSKTSILADADSYTVETNSSTVSQKIADYKLSDLKNAEINIIKLSSWCNWTNFNNHIFISEITKDWKNISASFTLMPDLENWKYQYSLKEFQTLFVALLKKYKFRGRFHRYDREIDWFEIEFKFGNKNTSIAEFLKPFDNDLRRAYEETVETLNLQMFSNSITNKFFFPDELKIPCEQYLLYFAQFLQDLGINATSSLNEEAGKVLFSVTPTDDVEALDKIREALAVYLNLPSSPIVYNESFASMRLKQQVDNLQHAQRMTEMEFRLAQKVIESQDKVIQQKDLTIEQQAKIIEKVSDKAVMINSAENKEELEELFDSVKVGKSKFLAEQIGLHLNPATALKSLGKKMIGKDDEIISLNLNEKTDLRN